MSHSQSKNAASTSPAAVPNGVKGLGARRWPVCLLLALLTFAVYAPVRTFDFIPLDDLEYVQQNSHTQDGLTWRGIVWAFTTTHASNWHPVTWLSHMLDAQLFRGSAGGAHVVNLLFHIANAVLLFLLLRKITGAHWRSAWVAALFALHPLHVESVAWVSERKDVLSTLFGWLTILFYVRYVETKAHPSAWRFGGADSRAKIYYAAALLVFALGLMSKPMLVTLPFLLLLLDYWPLGRISGFGFRVTRAQPDEKLATRNPRLSTLVLEKTPFFLLVIGSCVITTVAQQQAVRAGESFSLLERVLNAFVSYARYLGKMVWPADLALPYPHPGQWPLALVIFSVLLVVGISVAAIWLARKAPYLFVGWFWFLGTLVPVIGLVQVGIQSLADRYTYVPFVGVFIAVTWGAREIFTHWRAPRMFVIAAAVGILGACAARTADQVRYWKDGGTLFRHAIAVTERNALAHYCLGYYLWKQGELTGALEHYQAARAIRPQSVEVLNDLGAVLDDLGRRDEAAHVYQEALRFAPHNALAHYRLGQVLIRSGKNAEALEHFTRAVELEPKSVEARNNLGVALFRERRVEAAIEQFREITRLRPDYAEAHFNLGNGLSVLARWEEAAAAYREAVRLKPEHAEGHYALARALARTGQLELAVTHAREALRLKGDYPAAAQLLETLTTSNP